MSARGALLLVLGALAAAGVAFFLLLPGGGAGRQGAAGPRPVATPGPGDAEPPAAPLALPAQRAEAVGDGTRTSVLWPLRVELELVRAAYLPVEEGVQPIGSGRSSRLSGRILDASGQGAQAEITFLGGANVGRVLGTDATGAFGASDLYPGLSVVEVRGPAILGSRRTVRLRQDREQLLNIGYGRPASVLGRVVDREGNGLDGADVVVDGTRVATSGNGDFQLSSVAAGEVLVEVEKSGYAMHQEVLSVTGGQALPRERLTIVLERESTLLLTLEENVGGPGPAQVLLLPGNFEQRTASTRGARFPWYKLGAIELFPGTPRQVSGLPAEVVRVYAFRPGAVAAPRVANLRSQDTFAVAIHLAPAPRITGVVRWEGRTVAGARVRLEAPNPVRAMLGYFREPSYFLETGVLPLIPPAVQEVTTDGGGRFALTSWSELAPARWLEVNGPGNAWAGRMVHEGDLELTIELEERPRAEARLEVALPGRTQGLPVELVVGGAPSDPFVLAPHEDLRVESLVAGVWHLKASWNGELVREETALAVEGRTALTLELPAGAREGQDEETWRRAGREARF